MGSHKVLLPLKFYSDCNLSSSGQLCSVQFGTSCFLAEKLLEFNIKYKSRSILLSALSC